jgi:hypothetical protein
VTARFNHGGHYGGCCATVTVRRCATALNASNGFKVVDFSTIGRFLNEQSI